MSRVGVLSRLHNAVGNLATYIWLRQSFVTISFERCRYILAHVACRNLPWQGLFNSLPVSKDLLSLDGKSWQFITRNSNFMLAVKLTHPQFVIIAILSQCVTYSIKH